MLISNIFNELPVDEKIYMQGFFKTLPAQTKIFLWIPEAVEAGKYFF
jgi:hypothetical protein